LPLFVCLLHEIFREGWQRASEQMIKLWWQFGSQIWIGKLVIRALVEVWIVAVLLVNHVSLIKQFQRVSNYIYVQLSRSRVFRTICYGIFVQSSEYLKILLVALYSSQCYPHTFFFGVNCLANFWFTAK